MFWLSVSAQNTFNYRLDFDRPVPTVFTSIEVTDSCYYVCGITNHLTWPYRVGSLFARLNLEGEIDYYNTLTDSLIYYGTWRNTLKPTADGNFIVTGSASKPPSNILIKYTPEGDTIFSRRYLSPYYPIDTIIFHIASTITLDRGYLLLNNISPFNHKINIYAVKTDSMGNVEWDKIYGAGTNWTENTNSVLCLENGGYIIGGSLSNHNFVNNNFIFRTYIFQVDSLGEVEWEYLSPEGELQNSAFGMLPTSDGGLVIASGKGVEYVSGPNSLLEWRHYVYKIDSDRNFEWGVDIRDSLPYAENIFTKLIAPSDGSGYVAVGLIYNVNYEETGWDLNGLIAKVSTEGDSLWIRRYNYVESPADYHIFYDVEETADGGFIMVGQATDHFTGGESPLQQAWIVKVDEYGCLVPGCQLIDNVSEPVIDLKLSLYPNPARDYLNVFYYDPAHRGEVNFCIVDVQGKLMQAFSSRFNDITHIIPLSGYPAGQYYLQAEIRGEVVSKAFVVGR